MPARKGKIFVIEGPDGSGKRTQTGLLKDHLLSLGHTIEVISFPQYGSKSAGAVEEYLNGKYGNAADLNPYSASVLYAVDRFDASHKIRDLVENGTTVILDRYIDSNAAHQGGKIADLEKRETFLTWLYDLEYNIFGIPKPDRTVVLHVPAETGQALALQKEKRNYIEGGKKLDGHESNIHHLKGAEDAYLWLAEKDPERYSVIECMENGILLSKEAIHEKVKTVVSHILEA